MEEKENKKIHQSIESPKEKKVSQYKRLSSGVRKFIRGEKARFRKEISDPKEQDKLIKKLYERFTSNS